MKWTLRQSVDEDKEFMCDLNRLAYSDVVRRQFGKWDEEWQRQHFEEKWVSETFDIVEMGEQRIGVLCISRTDEEIRILEIQLHPEFQGQGIGTEILQHELQYADTCGLPVRLRVLRENRARKLYERLGFQVCGETATHFLMARIGK